MTPLHMRPAATRVAGFAAKCLSAAAAAAAAVCVCVCVLSIPAEYANTDEPTMKRFVGGHRNRFLTTRYASCRPANNVKALKGEDVNALSPTRETHAWATSFHDPPSNAIPASLA